MTEGQPFDPSPQQRRRMPLFSLGRVPRYLFRLGISSHKTLAPGSYTSSTSSTAVKSPACVRRQNKKGHGDYVDDIFQLPDDDAARLLNSHLRWWGRHEPDCNLVSWSSSLLVVLQYALQHSSRYREAAAQMQHPGEYSTIDNINEGYSSQNLRLLILDTSSFPKDLFVKDVEIIDALASDEGDTPHKLDLQYMQGMRRGAWDPDGERFVARHYFGEYLTQGCLRIRGGGVQGHGAARETSLRELLDHGLFHILPELSPLLSPSPLPPTPLPGKTMAQAMAMSAAMIEDDTPLSSCSWAKRVVELRDLWGMSSSGDATATTTIGWADKNSNDNDSVVGVVRPPVTPELYRQALALAQGCFGGGWTLPVLLMVLSLKYSSQYGLLVDAVGHVQRPVLAMFTREFIFFFFLIFFYIHPHPF